MDLQSAKILATKLMTKHGLYHWSFEWNNQKCGLGECDYTKHTIGLSKHFTNANSQKIVKSVILHEIAHALVGYGNGHNYVFKQKCREIGTTFDGCRVKESCGVKINMPVKIYNWTAECENCGHVYNRVRNPTLHGISYCGICNEKIPLKFKNVKKTKGEKK